MSPPTMLLVLTWWPRCTGLSGSTERAQHARQRPDPHLEGLCVPPRARLALTHRGRVASTSWDRPAAGTSSLNSLRSWGLTSCSLAAARHPKWGLASTGHPAASPTLGVRLRRGSGGTPGKGKGETMEVKWALGTLWVPWAGTKGHKPLGMSDPLTWDGRGQLARLAHWRGFS